MGFLRTLFFTSAKSDNVTNSLAGAGDDPKPTPAFVTVQSLATFPGSATAVLVIWKFFDSIFGINDRWVPVAASFLIAGLLLILAWKHTDSRGVKFAAIVLAAINGMYLALSVLGIDIGLDRAGIIDQTGGATGGG